MRNKKQLAACMAALLTASLSGGLGASAAENGYSIDMTDYNDEAWTYVAMANDDTVTTGANIRSSADEGSAVVGYLYRGGAVTVLDKGDTWTEVSSGGVTGYIRNEYLVYGTQAKGLAEYYGTYGVRASWDDVNVFAAQDAASKVVDTASSGDTYMTIGSDGHWVEVQSGADSTAYVSAEDVTPVILVNSAVSVDSAQGAGSYSGAAEAGQALPAASGQDASDQDTADQDISYQDTSYQDTSSQDTSYQDTSYTEETGTEETYTAETYAPEDAGAAAGASYTAPSTDGMDLAAKAQTLYQAYLEAQNAADAAVANGADEQTIYDTAAAAQAAYAVYVEAQNAADAAAWGTASGQDSAPSASAETADTTSSQSVQTEDAGQTDQSASWETQETQAPETEADISSNQTVSSSDLELLAALIYCEAGNQPYDGQVAVGAVVMNRVASGSFPNTISDVIYQSGQFTPAYSGALASALASGAGSSYIGAASAAMAGEDPTGGCLYFNTSHGSGIQIGAHWFY